MDCLIQATAANPDYGLLITGYSLGAGIGHLVSFFLPCHHIAGRNVYDEASRATFYQPVAAWPLF